MRIEKDTWEKLAPEDSYYGAQTKRAFDNFQISSKNTTSMISSIAITKRSPAVNNQLNFIDSKVKDAIVKFVMKSFKENMIINLQLMFIKQAPVLHQI